MCGIAGYVLPEGRDASGIDTVMRMTRLLARRGPDDEGIALFHPEAGTAAAVRTSESAEGAWFVPPEEAACDVVRLAERSLSRFEHRVALGHRRFSIIDPSPAGHQPFWSSDGAVCVCFNGEIYNYVELRAELEALGSDFRTRSDTEVLGEAYLRWGEGCFERFVGFWALALYDRRQEALLLARDRMGEAPLYVSRVGGTLYWASEIKSVRAGAGPSALGVSAQRVSDFVTFAQRDFGNATFFEGVEAFPAASWSWVGRDASLAPHRYWRVPERRLREREITGDDAAAELHRMLSDAVRLRLRADVPVGVELSGGVDSSALVATAAADGYSLRAFTVSFPGTDQDEARFAEAVARKWNDAVEHTLLHPQGADFFASADDYVTHMDEPFHSPNMFASQQNLRAMQAEGIRVTMSGAAGDELFGGYPDVYYLPFLAGLLESGHWLRLHREISALVEAPSNPASSLYWSRLAKAAFHAAKRRSSGINALGASRRTEAEAAPILRATPRPIPEPATTIEEVLRGKVTSRPLSYWLRATHQNTMCTPIELRLPFLDHRVVEFAFSLPLTYLIRDGWLKWILRKSVADLLPQEVTYRRRKLGFPFPLEAWLAENKLAFFAALRGQSEECPFIDLRCLIASYDTLARSNPMLLWRAMSVCLWWKRVVLNEKLGAATGKPTPAFRRSPTRSA